MPMTAFSRASLLAATMLNYPALGQGQTPAATDPVTVSVLPADTGNAQDEELKAQIDALSARVTALEKGQPKPPDPAPAAESPDLATVASSDSPTATYSIALGKAVFNGKPVQDTGSAATGGPPQPGDPSVAAPPQPTGQPPPPAAGVGFNVATASGKVSMGSGPNNWRLWDGRAAVKTNADGTVTVSAGRSNGYNAHIVTAVPNAGSFLGKTFKGSCGGYYAMQFSFPGTAVQNNGWPGFWANDIENQISQGGGLAHWPNQAAGYVTSVEVDVVEWMSGNARYGGALHHWYGLYPYPATNTEASGSPFAVPAGTNTAQPHWYGGLHVPATATSQGYFEWYFDHKKVGNRMSWNKYNAASPPPPVNGSTAYAVMDERNLYWIAGSGPTNPITISAFEAWQPRADCTTSR